MTTAVEPRHLTAKDFVSDQEVRWCPGCGDYAILKSIQKTLADVGARPENTVFVSGIGCSSRLPYYVSTYGFHTIHGRAPAIATGIKLANPELDVWVITGDGDALSIGGNHTLHILRRNVNVHLILFNNEIYGLTKGQYSPTSRRGTRSPSTPAGSIEAPVSTCAFALGANARFVARSIDTSLGHMGEVLKRAHANRGTSFVEVFQNCVVYNDAVFEGFTAKEVAADMQLHLEHGKPMIFGKSPTRKGLRLKPGKLEFEVVTIGENGVTESDIQLHDEKDRTLAWLLASLTPPEFPVALGVLYCDPAPVYEEVVNGQVTEAQTKNPNPSLGALLTGGGTWTVK